MSMPGRRVRVAVVFGGRSTEHAISCVSAGSVLAALDPARYEVVPVGITPKGAWVITSGDPEALRISGRELPTVETGTAVVLPGDPTAGGLVVVEPGEGARVLHGVDVVFPVLHGPYGEDGTIQGLLEMAGVPYVGSGVLGSAVAMDKEFTKKLLAAEGLPVGPYAVVRAGAALGRGGPGAAGPAGVRQAGPRRLVDRDQPGGRLGRAAGARSRTARAADDKVLVEAAVPGREIECGVLEGLDGAPPDVSVPAEILLTGGREWYDFEAKYLDDVSALDIPADLPADVTARLRELAARAFTALDCAGLARVDFFVGAGGEVTVNEVNTMPGFTPISMFPRVWAASGLDYPDLLDRLVRTALAGRG